MAVCAGGPSSTPASKALCGMAGCKDGSPMYTLSAHDSQENKPLHVLGTEASEAKLTGQMMERCRNGCHMHGLATGGVA